MIVDAGSGMWSHVYSSSPPFLPRFAMRRRSLTALSSIWKTSHSCSEVGQSPTMTLMRCSRSGSMQYLSARRMTPRTTRGVFGSKRLNGIWLPIVLPSCSVDKRHVKGLTLGCRGS
ncbi:hypothetical protein GSI_08681 [Ganoderma sinense ZZ0214-1]|uniref:Uncharacterized protein n=1 Tax=Ganoderma sinense ZZ0214-1 TaxID=1077348 RepID=A0A2G8S4D3_9APHY|nr:hypothetical protein GSI_08681 [Ganoderma sinense ZZ0214-1]